MKYTIIYRRTIQTKPYTTSTIGLSVEFDTAEVPIEAGYYDIRDRVDRLVLEERNRLAEK